MKVFVIQNGELDNEVQIYWHRTAERAMYACERREGKKPGSVSWEYHDSHGACWVWGKYVVSELREDH